MAARHWVESRPLHSSIPYSRIFSQRLWSASPCVSAFIIIFFVYRTFSETSERAHPHNPKLKQMARTKRTHRPASSLLPRLTRAELHKLAAGLDFARAMARRAKRRTKRGKLRAGKKLLDRAQRKYYDTVKNAKTALALRLFQMAEQLLQ